MTPNLVIELGRDTLWTCLLVVGPIMAVGFVIGMVISFLQAILQIQEMTFAFVPKLLAMGMALVLFGHWMLEKLMVYTHKLLSDFTIVIGG